jgi:hypothetical protein
LLDAAHPAVADERFENWATGRMRRYFRFLVVQQPRNGNGQSGGENAAWMKDMAQLEAWGRPGTSSASLAPPMESLGA